MSTRGHARWTARNLRHRLPLRFERLEDRAVPATFTVLNTDDDGAGSLRQAITDANGNPGADRIEFAIGTGAQTIQPLSALPWITDPVTIDGTTQPGYDKTPLIELDGSQTFSEGLYLTDHVGSVIQGLVINRFSTGISVSATGGGHTIRANYIGTTADGTAAAGNSSGGVSIVAGANAATVIGGPSAGDGNVISGNQSNGISVSLDFGSTTGAGPTIQNNRIGTNAAGDDGVPNTSFGVEVTTYGGSITDVVVRDSVIAGNQSGGVSLQAYSFGNPADVPGAVIAGNRIGTTADGSKALGNGSFTNGISLSSVTGTVVGGPTAADANLIAGNEGSGISYTNSSLTGEFVGPNVIGNVIGVGLAEDATLPNGSYGISINNSSGTMTGLVVRGNTVADDVRVEASSFGTPSDITGAVIAGNKFGTTSDGLKSLAEPTVTVQNVTNPLIGGTAKGDGNVSSGPIQLTDVTGAVVQGNWLGVSPDGATVFPGSAARLSFQSSQKAVTGTVGGTADGAGNVIAAAPGQPGVRLASDSFGGQAVLVTISQNRVTDLATGITFDTGFGTAPELLNEGIAAPVLDKVATKTDTGADVTGTLAGLPNEKYRLELFSDVGRVSYLGFADVTTDDKGTAAFTFPADMGSPFEGGTRFVATATRVASGATSPYSSPSRIPGGGLVVGYVFRDDNNTKYQDPTENGDYVTVFADLDGDGKLGVDEPSAMSSGNGKFELDLARDGKYTLRVAPEPGLVVTTAETATVSVSGGKTYPGPDFGVRRLGGAVSGVLYYDTNGNGKRDPGESAISPYTYPYTFQAFADLNGNGKLDDGEPSASPQYGSGDPTYTLTGFTADGSVSILGQTTNPAYGPSSTRTVVLVGGAYRTGQDIGFKPVDGGGGGGATGGTVTGTLFYDVDGDGKYGDGDLTLSSSQIVYLDLDGDGAFNYTEPYTYAYGSYSLTSTKDGTFAVRLQNAPATVTITGPADTSVTFAGGAKVAGPDLGYQFKTGGIVTGRVFLDADGDGAYDPGEGVYTQVYADTDGDGKYGYPEPYVYTDYSTGSYQLALPTGGTDVQLLLLQTVPTGQELRASPGKLSVTGGGVFSGNDFRLVRVGGTVSGVVFEDLNGDGKRDPGEPSYTGDGYTVFLDLDKDGKPSAADPQTTPYGSYSLGAPADGEVTVILTGSPAGSAVTTAVSATVTVAGGVGVTGPAFGIQRTAGGKLTGTVYFDADADGVRDDGEVAPSAVLQQLAYGELKVYIDTDGNGKYDGTEPTATVSGGSFSFNVGADAAGKLLVAPNPGGFAFAGTSAPAVSIAGGKTADPVDFGVRLTAGGVVSGTLFNDADGDGTWGPGEAVLDGVGFYLDVNGDGVQDPTEPSGVTTTPYYDPFTGKQYGGGGYRLEARADVAGVLRFNVPSGAKRTTPAEPVALANGVILPPADVGYRLFGGTISGTVFGDADGDGKYGYSEAPLGLLGVTVYLDLDGDGQLDPDEPAQLTYESGGSYSFAVPDDKSYTVRLLVRPGYAPTGSDSATLDVAGGQAMVADFGLKLTVGGYVSGTAFYDADGDGKFGDGDLAFVPTDNLGYPTYAQAVTVRPYLDANNNGQADPGEPMGNARSDGSFSFEVYADGTYPVRLTYESPLYPGGPTVVAPGLTVGGGATAGLDVGYKFSAGGIVTGQVFYDANGNGKYDAGEQGFYGQVFLDTNGNGKYDYGESYQYVYGSSGPAVYRFLVSEDGDYRVRFSLGQGYAISTAVADSLTVSGGKVAAGVDFGVKSVGGTVSGTVFADLNGDGERQGGEPALPGAKVFVDLNNNAALDDGEPFSTDSYFYLRVYVDGDFPVLVLPPDPGFTVTTKALGVVTFAGNNYVSAPPVGLGRTTGGFVRGVAFYDADGDGVRDDGEPAFAPSGDLMAFLDADGDGLPGKGEPTAPVMSDGSFLLIVRDDATAAQVRVTSTGAGTLSYVFPVAPGAVAVSGGKLVDLAAGYKLAAGGVVSGVVFEDANRDGVRDPGENGLPSSVYVYADLNGDGVRDPEEPQQYVYGYSSSAPSPYQLLVPANGPVSVRVDATLWGYAVSTPDRALTFTGGEAFFGTDFGFKRVGGTVSGTVFADVDGDGKQSSGEPLLPGVTVFVDGNGNGQLDATESSSTDPYFYLSVAQDGTFPVLAVLPDPGFKLTTAPLGEIEFVGGKATTGAWVGLGRTTGGFVRGVAFYDGDGDGVRDDGEPAFVPDGGLVAFLDADGDGLPGKGEPTAPVATDGSFLLVVPDDATAAQIRLASSPVAKLSYVFPVAPGAVAVSGGKLVDLAAGYKLAAGGVVSGVVFADTNKDGVRDPGEAGLSGRTVFLDANGNGLLDPDEPSTTTRGNYPPYTDAKFYGQYQFVVPNDGKYQVVVSPGYGYAPTTAAGPFELTQGALVTDADRGFRPVGGSVYLYLFTDVDGDGKRGNLGYYYSGDAVTVFLDKNGDGTQDPDEPWSKSYPGSNSVSVQTDIDGTYTPVVVAPNGQKVTTALEPLELVDGKGYSFDVGLRLTTGGYVTGDVFYDADADGKLGDGEYVGVEGVRVFLDLDDDGKWTLGEPSQLTPGSFTLATPDNGSYPVRVVADGTVFQATQTTPAPVAGLSDGAYVPGLQVGVKYTAGGILTGQIFVDANLNGTKEQDETYPPYGSTVFADLDENGKLDGGEPTAYGYSSYRLAVPENKEYKLGIVLPSGTAPVGAAPTTVKVEGGAVVAGPDFGVKLLGGTVSASLFLDLDQDGKQDPGESYVQFGGLYVDLNGDGKQDPNEPFGTGGVYYTAPADGAYTVRLIADPRFAATGDSSFVVNLVGGIYESRGLGIKLLSGGRVTGTVFYDTNKDGKRDPGEVGVAPTYDYSPNPLQAYIDLNRDGQNTWPEPATGTSADGRYSIASADDGPAAVRLWVYSYYSGQDTFVLSPPPADVTLAGGKDVTGVDLGFTVKAGGLAAGTLFNDLNGNGQRDDGENPLTVGPGSLRVYDDVDGSGSLSGNEPTAWVNPDGSFALLLNSDGAHKLSFTAGSLGAIPTTPTAAGFDLSGGGAKTGLELGVRLATLIRGTVFDDQDRDGFRDYGSYPDYVPEPGMPDVVVFADLDGDGAKGAAEPSAVTDKFGSYTLEVAGEGKYAVVVVPPAGKSPTTPVPVVVEAKGGGNNYAAMTGLGLAAGGFVVGSVFADANSNGTRDEGEAPASGAVVFLDADGDGKRGDTETAVTTGPDGKYRLFVPDDGPFTVALAPRDGVTITTAAKFAGEVKGGATVAAGDFGTADSIARVVVADAKVQEGDSGTTKLVFTVTRTGNTGSEAAVTFATADGTGKAGVDYTSAAGTLTLPAGATTGTISVVVAGNTRYQDGRTVLLNLTAGTGVELSAAAATGTVWDDDAPQSLVVVPGSSQSAQVGTAFPARFEVEVRNNAGAAVEGVVVVFAAPATGAGGTFASEPRVTTGATGRAVAPVFTANDQAGSYAVAAVAAGGSKPDAAILLTNTAAPAANTAPTLAAGTPALTPVASTDPNPPGNLVSVLIAGGVTDPDAGALAGVAITGAAAVGTGTWQFSTDGGATWAAFPAVSANAALLLRDLDLVRFVPAGSTGTPTLTFRAWDRTAGTAGETGDVTTAGGTTAFSTDARTATAAVAATLVVADVTPPPADTAGGVTVAFVAPIDPTDVNLYTTQSLGLANDMTLVAAGDDGQPLPGASPVMGTLVIAPDGKSVEFVPTGGPLAGGKYVMTASGGAGGFGGGTGALDGDDDGTPGGDYVTVVTVAAPAATLVSLPDFGRGPSQPVDLAGGGLPVRVTPGTGVDVTALAFEIEYNPALLTITDAAPGGQAPDGSGVTFQLVRPGLVRITYTGGSAVTGTAALSLVSLVAEVPADAPLGEKAVLRLRNLAVNDGAVAATADPGVQLVGLFGDLNSRPGYSAADAALAARLALRIDSGLATFLQADARILADIDGDGKVSAADAARIARKALRLSVVQIPDPPAALPTAAGEDPVIAIGRAEAAPGGSAEVPVTLTVPAGEAPARVVGVTIMATYDPAVLTVTAVRVSDEFAAAGFFALSAVDADAGTVTVSLASTGPGVELPTGTTTPAVVLVADVAPTAVPGTVAAINLVPSLGWQWTGSEGPAGWLPNTQPPTAAADDPVDGAVAVAVPVHGVIAEDAAPAAASPPTDTPTAAPDGPTLEDLVAEGWQPSAPEDAAPVAGLVADSWDDLSEFDGVYVD